VSFTQTKEIVPSRLICYANGGAEKSSHRVCSNGIAAAISSILVSMMLLMFDAFVPCLDKTVSFSSYSIVDLVLLWCGSVTIDWFKRWIYTYTVSYQIYKKKLYNFILFSWYSTMYCTFIANAAMHATDFFRLIFTSRFLLEKCTDSALLYL